MNGDFSGGIEAPDTSGHASRWPRQSQCDILSLKLCSLAAFVMAIAVSLYYLHVSQAMGRLHQDITYDDVVYVNDAAARLDLAKQQSLLTFVSFLLKDPPHSPFSTILATGALVAGGYKDHVFYAANSVLLLLVTLFLVRQFKGCSIQVVLWIVAVFLSSPLAYRAIHDFRPDVALGFCSAGMVWWFVQGFREGQMKSYWYAGYAFGAALLIKPSFFAHTLALAIFLAAMYTLLRRPLAGAGWNSVQTGKPVNLAVFAVVGLCIAAPYFAANGTLVFRYFWSNTRGEEAAIWSFAADTPLLALVKAYLSVCFQSIGGFHLPLALTCMLGGVGSMLYRRDFRNVGTLAILFGFAWLSFGILVFGRHKNEFFFAAFQSLITLSTFSAVAYSTVQLTAASRRWVLVALWLGLGGTIYANGYLQHWQPSIEAAAGGGSWNTRIVDLIEREVGQRSWTQPNLNGLHIFVSVAGPVSSDTIKWTATKRGWRWDVVDAHRSRVLADFVAAARDSNYVVVPNEDYSEYYRWLPSATVQQELLALLRQDPRFRPLEPFSSTPHYFVFENSKTGGG